MAKKQTRRSISVSRDTYSRVKTYCELNGFSMSSFVERRVKDFFDADARATTVKPVATVTPLFPVN